MKASSIPCAVYTRKSSEEGLEQDFNSLDAQREACLAYIQSQKGLGWTALRADYSDGGFSGGTTQRPALQRLLADISAAKVKVVVVYKVDRLTRSLADFAKMVELFDAHGVSFVSVTQQFNTTSSMGRLTLNVLLSFAQFEREITGERIRDKIAASKRKGMWMGGWCPMGYQPGENTLVVDEAQAERVRAIFRLYLELGNVRLLEQELNHRGWKTPQRKTARAGTYGDRPFSRGHLYKVLSNPIYRGQIPHKGDVHPGNHPALIDEALWNAVQQRLRANQQGHKGRSTADHSSLLVGRLFDGQGNRFTPSHTQKGSKRYRYYVQQVADAPLRIPAQRLESAVRRELEDFLGDEQRWAHSAKGDARQLQAALQRARGLLDQIRLGSRPALEALLHRVIAQADRLVIEVRTAALWNQDLVAVEPSRIEVPIALKRSGMAVRLLVQGEPSKNCEPDARLIRLLAQAQDWAGRLISGEAEGMQAIADAERVQSLSYVSRVAQLAFLSPDLVQAIVVGRQPVGLTPKRLIGLGVLPMSWDEQRKFLGFE